MKFRWLAAASGIVLAGGAGAQSIAQAAAASPGAVRAHGTAVVQVQACRPQQLRLHNGPKLSQATQQNAEIFVLRNASSHRCRLDGYPVVALHTGRGNVLLFRYRDHGDQMLTGARPHLVVLAPGRRAYFGINKQTCVGRSTRTARTLAIFPLGRLAAALPRYPMLGYCGRQDPGHVVDISPFEKTAQAVLAQH